MMLNKYVWYIIFLPLIIGGIYYRKLNKSHKFIYWFIVLGTITEITSKFLRKLLDIKNNMPLGHFYIVASFFFVALFFFYELKDFISRKVIIGVIIFFALFSVFNILFIQSYLVYPSIPGSVSALLLVSFSILLYAHIMKEGKIQILSQSSVIWINSAILIYYSGNFFFYILFNFLLSYSRDFLIKTLNFFALVTLVFYVLVAIGLYKAGKTTFLPE
jgi:hypothetical protein